MIDCRGPNHILCEPGVLTLWCTVGLLRHPMPVSGDSHSGDMTHSIMCSVRCSHRRPVSLPHSVPCSFRFSDNGAAGVPSPLTAPLLGSSTHGSSTGLTLNTPAFVGQVYFSLPCDGQSSSQSLSCALLFSQSLIALSSVEVLAQVFFLCE